MPAHLKPPSQRSGHAKRAPLRALQKSDVPTIVPKMPPGEWLKATRDAWDQYWASGVATMADLSIDDRLLHRWVWCNDELLRAEREFRRERTVIGSKGQPVLSPHWAQITNLQAELAKLEAQLGIGPLNRMRLGIAIGGAADAMSDLDMFGADDADDDGDVVMFGDIDVQGHMAGGDA